VTDVVLLAVFVAVGLLGIVSGLRSTSPPLDDVWSAWQRPVDPGRPVRSAQAGRPGRPGHSGRSGRLGQSTQAGRRSLHQMDRLVTETSRQVTDGRWAAHPSARSLRCALDVTDTDLSLFVSRVLVTTGACAVGPVALWFALQVMGITVPFGVTVLAALAAVPLVPVLSVTALHRRAAERRRHVRVVVGSFVDLVVLGLAGGVGIDGALHAASLVTPDWAARRLAAALLTARDSGAAPWDALASLGDELGVPELVELATTVKLAGTEGARIRQTLTARGASLRRHEQAEAESAANAMTERLFLPGALLLLGFLTFIGYPAVHRILGGF
jgi:hypothetical protein